MSIHHELVSDEVKAGGRQVLSLAMDKFTHDPPQFNLKTLERAKEVVKAKMSVWSESKDWRRDCTDHEMINGIEGSEFKRIDLTTSCGAYWKWIAPPSSSGKSAYFDVTPHPETNKKDTYAFTIKDYNGEFIGKQLEEEVSKTLSELHAGIITPYVFIESLKDERRKLAKIYEASTRSFDIAPLHQLLAGRKLFGGFLAASMAHPVDNEISVGINMLGSDATGLRGRMNKHGGLLIAGDHKNWDGNCGDQIRTASCECINHGFYGKRNPSNRARMAWVKGTTHSYHLAANTLVAITTGMKSGLPTTSPENSVCNWLELLCAIIEIAEAKGCPRLTTQQLIDEVEFAIYGDDHLIALSARLRQYVDFFAMQEWFEEHGLVYTSATKNKEDEEAFTHIDNVSYLKRHFKHLPGTKFYTAPLDMTSITELLNWRRTKNDLSDEEYFKQAMENFHRELFHHGEETYNSYLDHVNDKLEIFRKENPELDPRVYRRQPNQYNDYLDLFLANFNVC